MIEAPFSIADLRARATERLDLDHARLYRDLPAHERWGDHTLNPGAFQVAERRGGAPAAVLVPVVAHASAPTVLLTQRASHLRQHSGQIAFPGGRMDACDASPIECALREAREEIGLASRHVEPIAYLDPYVTGTGFRVFPVLAVVTPG